MWYPSANKASVIKLVNLYSNIKMMHGPIRIRSVYIVWSQVIAHDVKPGCFVTFVAYVEIRMVNVDNS